MATTRESIAAAKPAVLVAQLNLRVLELAQISDQQPGHAEQANQALLDAFRRLNPGQHLVGDQICVFSASLGVDTQATPSAPSGESGRVYVYTDNPDAFSLLSLSAYLGIPQPLVESAMQFVTVLKHGHQPVEILALVPDHADGLNLLAHDIPRVVETCIVGEES